MVGLLGQRAYCSYTVASAKSKTILSCITDCFKTLLKNKIDQKTSSFLVKNIKFLLNFFLVFYLIAN